MKEGVYIEILMFLALLYGLTIMWLRLKKYYYKFRNVKFFKDLYLLLILLKSNIPTSQEYFPTLFRENKLNRI